MYIGREVVQLHEDAINEHDLTKCIDTTVFPFTYHNYNGTSTSVKNRRICILFPAPWETVFAAFPEWLLTKHDEVDDLVSLEDSKVFKVVARRLPQDDKPHKPITAVWVTVRNEGRWELHFRYDTGSI